MVESILKGASQAAALKRIARLNPHTPESVQSREWLDVMKKQRLASYETPYRRGLAETLQGLVCGGDANAIHVLRGIAKNGRLAAAGAEAPGIIDAILSKKCAVSEVVSPQDKAVLLKIKQEWIEDAKAESEPAPSPQKKPRK